MQTYHLVDEFTDTAAEQALLASIIGTPMLYWDVCDLLTPEVFTKEADTWRAVVLTQDTRQLPTIPADWLPAPDPHATARRLVDLHQRRLLATMQERLAQALFDETTSVPDIVSLLEEETLRVHAALRDSAAGQLQ